MSLIASIKILKPMAFFAFLTVGCTIEEEDVVAQEDGDYGYYILESNPVQVALTPVVTATIGVFGRRIIFRVVLTITGRSGQFVDEFEAIGQHASNWSIAVLRVVQQLPQLAQDIAFRVQLVGGRLTPDSIHRFLYVILDRFVGRIWNFLR